MKFLPVSTLILAAGLGCVSLAVAQTTILVRGPDGTIDCTLADPDANTPALNVEGLRVTVDVTQGCFATLVPSAFSVSPTTLVFDEGGVAKTFNISLDTNPAADVVVNISSQNTAIATVNKASVTLTSSADVQTVSVTPAANVTGVGNTNIMLTSTSGYANNNVPDVAVTVNDLDVSGCTDDNTDYWSPTPACTYFVGAPVVGDLTVRNPNFSLAETYIPGPGLGQGSVKAGEVWALRMIYTGGAVGPQKQLRLRDQGGNETFINWDIAISDFPGSFTHTGDATGAPIALPSACIKTNQYISDASSVVFDIDDSTAVSTGDCGLYSGRTYYANVRPNSSVVGCGTTKNCRSTFGLYNQFLNAGDYP